MNKLMDWGGPVFVRVSKKKYENFCRYFDGKLEYNAFMGWNDAYDFSYDKRYKEKLYGGLEHNSKYLDRCMVARHFFEAPKREHEYYIRVDYIWDNDYDLNTIVPKKRNPRLSRAMKKIADHMCDAFDIMFRQEALSQIIGPDEEEENEETRENFSRKN